MKVWYARADRKREDKLKRRTLRKLAPDRFITPLFFGWNREILTKPRLPWALTQCSPYVRHTTVQKLLNAAAIKVSLTLPSRISIFSTSWKVYSLRRGSSGVWAGFKDVSVAEEPEEHFLVRNGRAMPHTLSGHLGRRSSVVRQAELSFGPISSPCGPGRPTLSRLCRFKLAADENEATAAQLTSLITRLEIHVHVNDTANDDAHSQMKVGVLKNVPAS